MTGEQPVEDAATKIKRLEAELVAKDTMIDTERRLRELEVENMKLRSALQEKQSETPILDKLLGTADRFLDLTERLEKEERERPRAAPPAPAPEPERIPE